MSCLQIATCFTVGPQTGAVQYAGSGTWKAPVTVESDGQLDAVSCPTANFCMVVDDRGT